MALPGAANHVAEALTAEAWAPPKPSPSKESFAPDVADIAVLRTFGDDVEDRERKKPPPLDTPASTKAPADSAESDAVRAMKRHLVSSSLSLRTGESGMPKGSFITRLVASESFEIFSGLVLFLNAVFVGVDLQLQATSAVRTGQSR